MIATGTQAAETATIQHKGTAAMNIVRSLSFSLVAVAMAHGAAAAEPLSLGFLTRPGFAEMTDGKPGGAFLPIAAAGIAKTGLAVEWVPLPQKRLIEQVRQDMPNYCAVGIYKTPERLGFAKFSEPFYRDQRFIVVSTGAKKADIKDHKTLMSLTKDAKFKLGAVDGFSYGAEIDAQIKGVTTNLDLAVVTPDKLLAKLAAGRIDYTLAAPEELDTSMKLSGAKPDDLARIAFDDMPKGALRHLMCSKSVDDATIAKLNAGIASLRLDLE